jgi:hypothetical protein
MVWQYKKIQRVWANQNNAYVQVDGVWKLLNAPSGNMLVIANEAYFRGINVWVDIIGANVAQVSSN